MIVSCIKSELSEPWEQVSEQCSSSLELFPWLASDLYYFLGVYDEIDPFLPKLPLVSVL